MLASMRIQVCLLRGQEPNGLRMSVRPQLQSTSSLALAPCPRGRGDKSYERRASDEATREGETQRGQFKWAGAEKHLARWRTRGRAPIKVSSVE